VGAVTQMVSITQNKKKEEKEAHVIFIEGIRTKGSEKQKQILGFLSLHFYFFFSIILQNEISSHFKISLWNS